MQISFTWYRCGHHCTSQALRTLALVVLALALIGCRKSSESGNEPSILFGNTSSALPATESETASAPTTVPSPINTADPVPACMTGDGRTAIPMWTPSVDEKGHLSSDPPQKDGLIVQIQLTVDVAQVECNDEALNAFQRPDDPGNTTDGGLAVNLRGNTQRAHGDCYFSGYYMNEDVAGMHQGWVETYFGAVDKMQIVLSDKFCRADSLPEAIPVSPSGQVLTDTDPGYRDEGH